MSDLVPQYRAGVYDSFSRVPQYNGSVQAAETTYSKAWSSANAAVLQKISVRFHTYTGEELKLVGIAVVKIR